MIKSGAGQKFMQICGVQPKHAQAGLIPKPNLAVKINDEHTIPHGFHQRTIFLLALHQGALRKFNLRDVPRQRDNPLLAAGERNGFLAQNIDALFTPLTHADNLVLKGLTTA